MSEDDKIIDISHTRVLKEHDALMTVDNFGLKLKFANIAEELINQTIGKHDFQFFLTLKKQLPNEIINDFRYRNQSLDESLKDLNILSKIERMIGLNPIIFSPTCTDANLTGWISGFHMAECMFSSPEMDTEAKARAFSIILFLRMKDILKA